MAKWVSRAVMACVAILAGFAVTCGTMAGAQNIQQPPVVSAVDSNGVNLATGQFDLPEISIGIGGQGSGLARRGQFNSDNFSDSMQLVPGQDQGQMGGHGGPLWLYVSHAGVVHRFAVGGWTNTPSNQNYFTGPYNELFGGTSGFNCTDYQLGTAQGSCTLTLGDGSTVRFDRTIGGGAGNGLATTITKPDGEIVDISYYLSGSTAMGIKTVTSSLGWMLKYEYDGNFKLIKVTAVNRGQIYCDAAASSCPGTTNYPQQTKTVSGATTTIAQNGTTILTYTVSGATTTVSSPSGATKTVVTSGSPAKVASVTIGGSTWNYTYPSAGVTKVSNPDGTYRTVSFSTTTNMIASVTDELGRTTAYQYDSSTNRLIRVTQPDGDANGGYTTYAYDGRGNVTTVTIVPKSGSGLSNLVTQASYPAGCTNIKSCNKPIWVKDAAGVETDYVYDTTQGHGGVISETKAGTNIQTHYEYSAITPYFYQDASGVLKPAAPVWRVTAITSCRTGTAGVNGALPACATTNDAKKSVTAYSTSSATPSVYNNVLPSSTTVSLGDGSLAQQTSITYDVNGNVTYLQLVGKGDGTRTFYDALNRPYGTIGIDPDGVGSRPRPAQYTYYDSAGRAYKVDTGTTTGTNLAALNAMTVLSRDTNEFDPNTGLAIVARHYDGTDAAHLTQNAVVQKSYDNRFRTDCVAQRLNPAAFGAYGTTLTTSACALTATGPDGDDRIKRYTYDSTGALRTTTSGYASSTAQVDSLSAYNPNNGTLAYLEDGKGNRTSYSYDGFNRAYLVCYPSTTPHVSSTSDCEQTIYAANGRVSSTHLRDYSTDTTKVINFGYDAVGRVNSKSGAVTESISFDNFGDMTSHTNNGHTSNYDYNGMGWLKSESNDSIGGAVIGFGYDSFGRRNQLTYPDGQYVTYGYDAGDEMTGIYENGATALVTFDYDAWGRRWHLYRGNGQTTTYTYDNANGSNLLSVSQPANTLTFTYTNADQVKSKTNSSSSFLYTPSDRPLQTAGINGLNQISSTLTSGTTSTFGYDGRGNLTNDGNAGTYFYNAENLLTSATQSGITATLTYDAEDRLYSVSKSGYGTTRFVYDGIDLIAEYDSSGNLLRRYVHGPGDDEPLVWYEGSTLTDKRWLHSDDLGSVIGVTNNAGANTITNTYDPYGLPGTGSGRFRYTGQIWLPEVGMYYYKARLYNPAIGRFMQTDPIGYGDGMNDYAYLRGDPINGTDPSGLSSNGTYDDSLDPERATDVITVMACRHGEVMSGNQCFPADQEKHDFWYYSHWVLGGASFCPSICGSAFGYVDAAVYLGQGRKLDAALTAGAATIGLVSDAGAAKAAEEGGVLAFKAVKAASHACGCFVSGTEVATPTGLRQIEDVKVGDLVLAYNEQTGALVAEPVTGLIRPAPKPTYALTFKSAHGDVDTFRATADHPWLTKAHTWTPTEQLKAGDQIETATGEAFTLVSVQLSSKVEKTYNLEVQGLHTFLVGNDHLIVHNSSCTLVYHSVQNGVTKYVGITSNFAKRAAAHASEKGINISAIPGLSNLAQKDARAVEQVLIELHGIGTQGGSLMNKINSIATTNSKYGAALQRGLDLLVQAGYRF